MNLLAPQPRYRIYTNANHYTRVLKDVFLNKQNLGNELTDLAQQIKTLFAIPFALPMPTARFAIYLAIKSLITSKRKVILSPYTIVDVINMVICAGGIPVFADIETHSCNIDPQEIEKLIDDETAAVLITHLHGLACDLTNIKKICELHGVVLIEDCAQAFTAKHNGQFVGTFGDIGIFSFGMYKNVNSFYGGLLITNKQELHDKINMQLEQLPYFSIKHYFKKFFFAFATDVSTLPGIYHIMTYWIFRYAYLNNIQWINDIVTVDKNPMLRTQLPTKYQFKMTPMQARLILKQLPRIEENTHARIERAELYYQGLHDIENISLPPRHTDHSHLYTYYPIQVADRRHIVRLGHIHNRDWMLCHYHNLADLPCFSQYKRECPNARKVAQELIYLPTYPRYKLAEVEKNIRVLKKIILR